MVSPERVEYRVRPARYRTVHKRVLIKPARTRDVVHPAEYRTVRERVMVRPERWVTTSPPRYRQEFRRVQIDGERPGRSLERVGNHLAWVPVTLPPRWRNQLVTVMVEPEHHVRQPAVFETRTTRVLVWPERRERVARQARYAVVPTQVLVEPERRERVVVPARFETVTRQVMVAPERRIMRSGRVAAPMRRVKVRDGYTVWKRVPAPPGGC